MAIHKLNARQVETAEPGKYEDGGGLRLVVSNSGTKKWVFRFMLNGRRREMGLGGFPLVSLKEARDEADKCRKLVRQGIDPIEERRRRREGIPIFTSCAAIYIHQQRRSWKNFKHALQWVRTIRQYAVPVIGRKPVNLISTEDVLTILKPLWREKTETAKRLRGRIEKILDYAMAMRWRTESNPARWRGHLDKLLPKPSSVKQERHQPAMPYQDVPAFMEELAGMDRMAAKALQFLILTATRTSEVLKARWAEIDLENAVWIIPANRMKGRKEHRVPLPPTAITILRNLPKVEGNEYLFPGQRAGRPMSNMALLKLMRDMGFGKNGHRGDYVPHGFRSSFRDWAGEVTGFPPDVVEMALAHAIRNKTEAAYRRGDLFEKRRKLMEAWNAYLTHAHGRIVVLSNNQQRNTFRKIR